jgi:RNA polymerase sigma-70 factor (ECF subfamily)
MTDAATSALVQPDEPSDLDLIARWKAGDQRAATQLVERHAEAVTRFVASVGERTDVDDVVQDTFVRAFASLESFRGESTLRTWLFTIARRLVLDKRRSERRRGGGARMQVEVEDADAVTEYDALDAVVADETERRMREAVARLTPTQREVFTLRVGEGLSYREIAEAVDTTEGAARVHYHNAMRAVKEFLDE